VREAKRLAQRAIELGRDDALALCCAGALLVRLGDLNAGTVFIDRALALNPNLPAAWSCSSFVKLLTGELETAIERLAHVLRLSPRDPDMYMYEDYPKQQQTPSSPTCSMLEPRPWLLGLGFFVRRGASIYLTRFFGPQRVSIDRWRHSIAAPKSCELVCPLVVHLA
jgi:tetratricopeptide (TPR) repeat protein